MALLDQYLVSLLKNNQENQAELPLKAGEPEFNWFKLCLPTRNALNTLYHEPQVILLYLLAGQTTLKINNKLLEISAGNVLLLPKNQTYQLTAESETAILLKFSFEKQVDEAKFLQRITANAADQKQIGLLLEQLTQTGCLWFKNSQVSPISQMMQQIVDSYLNHALFTQSLIQAQMTILLINLIRTSQLAKIENTDSAGFAESELDKYIDVHFTEITLKQAAEYFGFNPNYFSNLVKQKTGKSFVAHIDDRRMQEARFLLAQPDISLKEIVKRCGYSSKSFFYKKFNQYYGQTPAAMRQHLFKQANINLLK